MKNNKVRWFSLIRDLGLLMVLVYHFFKNFLPGGFIGVDIFFVFSGYLITSLVIKEVADTSNFKLVEYYKRRFLRIFPPLLLMVLLTLPLSMLLPSDYRANIGSQAMAALSFVTNIFEMKSGASYESQFFPHFYVHTWTLSLEFLFYLAWGALSAFLVKFFRRPNQENSKQLVNKLKFALMIVSAVGTLASIIILQVRFSQANPSATYYSAMSHFYPFFIGSLTAIFYGIHLTDAQVRLISKKKSQNLLIFAGVATLILLIMAKFLTFDKAFTFRFGLILTSLITALLIIIARIMSVKSNKSEPNVFQYFANISYSMYLWHWPLWIVISYFVKNIFLAGLLALILTTIISTFVYYIIEPWFHGKQLQRFYKIWDNKRVRYALVAFFSILVIGDFYIGASAKPISELEASVYDGELSQTSNKIKDLGTSGVQMKTIFDSMYDTANFDDPKSGLTSDVEIAEKDVKYAGYAIPSTNIKGGVTLIGDSVLLGVSQEMADTIPGAVVDAQVNRNYQAGTQVFEQKLKEGNLGKYVVVALGTNPMGGDEPDYINRIIDELPAGSRLVFVVPYNAKNANDTLINTQDYLRSLPEKYDFVSIYDWPTDGKSYVKDMQDGVHLVYGNNLKRVYTSGVIKTLNQAADKPAKK